MSKNYFEYILTGKKKKAYPFLFGSQQERILNEGEERDDFFSFPGLSAY